VEFGRISVEVPIVILMPFKRIGPVSPLPLELWEKKRNKWKRIAFEGWENPQTWHKAEKDLNRMIVLDRRVKRVHKKVVKLRKQLAELSPELKKLFFESDEKQRRARGTIAAGQLLKSSGKPALYKAGIAMQKIALIEEALRKRNLKQRQGEAEKLLAEYAKAVQLYEELVQRAVKQFKRIKELEEPLRSELYVLLLKEKVGRLEEK